MWGGSRRRNYPNRRLVPQPPNSDLWWVSLSGDTLSHEIRWNVEHLRALKGYVHEFVNHTQKEYVRGDVHENRAECLFSLLKPYLRVFRGVSKYNLPGYVGFLQFLRNFRQRNAFEQAELILQAALDPSVASRARKGEFVTCFHHFDLLQ